MPAEEAMNETVVIVTGADALDERALAHVPSHAIVLAADGGLDHARAAGLSPAGLIGDLDSVSEDGLAWALEHATIQRHPVDKDLTDTELAVAFAAAMDPERLVLLAGGGDRLDHALSAIGSLGSRSLTGVPIVECWWGAQYIRVLHGPGRAVLDVDVGATVSLLALHGPCTGVVISGTKWPLDRVELEPLVGLGVSNVAIEARVELAVSTGVLTAFVGAEAA
jgi:thiamine pyrophosphokinase